MFTPYRRSRVGTRFGPYELRSLIGAGGMGEVYRAYDTRKGRMVALKLLRPELAADPGFQQRFRRESQLAARLQEPHVIPVHDFGEIDGVLFIDMRLVDGGSLKDLLRERGALDPGQAAAITAQVATALDAAHAEGLVHRDVKPENVLLTPDNFAYLVDFGLAQAHGDPSVTAGGPLIGSCAYMAPERFSGGPVGPQTDVYSLACVLYECLTGQAPFEGAEIPQLITAHLQMPPPRPSIMRRGIDKALDDVIARGMAKEPAARFSCAGELARAAFGLTASTPLPPPPPAPPSPPQRTRPFSAVYPNPDDTGYSPYPSPAPRPQRPANPLLGRAPVLVAGAAAA
ncbi:serine/threonine-protein kinase, partial [Mycobacterium sp. E796]|uniref:serine/threonine-protein kinase n=1 Tax=Mycobacterium sp. E796 TaxID=1834151 RepID=UPI0012EA2D38